MEYVQSVTMMLLYFPLMYLVELFTNYILRNNKN